MACPIPNAIGQLKPEGTGSNGVMILGEAMGDQEVVDGLPFRPYAPAGSVLDRAIRRVGMNRQSFVLWNVVPTHPPNNYLEGAPWEDEAVEWGRPYLEEMIERFKPRVILALGNVAVRATTGLAGEKLGVSSITGFYLPSRYVPVVPCFHPSFLRRGAMGLMGVLMRSIKMAVRAAAEGRKPVVPDMDNPPAGYVMYPTEADAMAFLGRARAHSGHIAYDIETLYSTAEEDAEERSGDIVSVQYSLGSGSGIYLPVRDPFLEVIRGVLGLPNPKLGWNNWRFDDPRIASMLGVRPKGPVLDLMWAWHHLQPDVPRNLQFAAAQNGWPWPWKHLDKANPQFYGIVDVDVLHFLA